MTIEEQETRPGRPPAERHPWHRFVALGDSYTEGVGDPEPRSIGGLRGWADRAAEELSAGQRDFAYANLAVRGMVLQEILDRQLEPALALKPDLIAMSGGGNDIVFHLGDPDKLAERMDNAVGLLAGTGMTVLLFAGPDWGSTPVLGQIRGRLAIYNEHLHRIGLRHHAVMVDLWCLPALRDARTWDRDRLHLSPLGHQAVAVATRDALAVPHALKALEPRPVPSHGWTQARSEDLIWARQYLFPWVLGRLRPHPAELLVAKRPLAGPVFGFGRPGPFPPGHPAGIGVTGSPDSYAAAPGSPGLDGDSGPGDEDDAGEVA
jgi:lysophospholipase L1-like esterase